MKHDLQHELMSRDILVTPVINSDTLGGIRLRSVTVWGEFDISSIELTNSLTDLASKGLALVRTHDNSFAVAVPCNPDYYIYVIGVSVHRDLQPLLTPSTLDYFYRDAYHASLANSKVVDISPRLHNDDCETIYTMLTRYDNNSSTDKLVADLNKNLKHNHEFIIKRVSKIDKFSRHATVTFVPKVWTQAAETAVSLFGLPTYTVMF